MSGWIGEPDTNSTTNTGMEAVNVAVYLRLKKLQVKQLIKWLIR